MSQKIDDDNFGKIYIIYMEIRNNIFCISQPLWSNLRIIYRIPNDR
nr:MAG TPA: hypothetical protein [Caudoviricetes sp.]